MARIRVQGVQMHPEERERLRQAAAVMGISASTLAYIILREATQGFISFGPTIQISDVQPHNSEHMASKMPA